MPLQSFKAFQERQSFVFYTRGGGAGGERKTNDITKFLGISGETNSSSYFALTAMEVGVKRMTVQNIPSAVVLTLGSKIVFVL